ncbi:MAG: hypothetical protein H7196_00060 [candidate division SR1 bacterium]|nr:hypothetical protein [candidate division SR1 bacterium]
MIWDLHDLVFDYYPRNIWVTHVHALMYCNLLPAQSEKSAADQILKDPSLVFTISPKNYTADATYYTSKYTNRDKYRYISNNYGIQLNIVADKTRPVWLKYVKNNTWYFNQIKAYKISSLLKILPGVKNVYLTGSSVSESSSPKSDIDFIIQAYKGQTWVARFWVKLFLKLFRLDVHDIVLEFYIKYIQLIKALKVVSLKNYEKSISKVEEKIWIKKTKGGLVDIGLFYEKFEDIESIFPKETRNFYIWSSLRIPNAGEENYDFDVYGGELLYWQNNSLIYNYFLKTIKCLLLIISTIIYPILNMQYYFYTNQGSKYIYFILRKDVICYFPIIFKPKSLLNYQIKD